MPGIHRVNGRPVLLGDGLKIPKRGRKTPAVKLRHPVSDCNTKPEYIMGHCKTCVAFEPIPPAPGERKRGRPRLSGPRIHLFTLFEISADRWTTAAGPGGRPASTAKSGSSFGSWLGTIRPGIPPSELVMMIALGNSLPDFLIASGPGGLLRKLMRDRLDLTRAEGFRLAG
jgi:hypothetical protein